MSPKQAQSTFNLHFKNGILWRRCKSCVIAYWLGSTEPIWSIMIISVGLQFFSVFSWAKYKSTTGAIMIKKFKFCFHRQIAYFQELLLEKNENWIRATLEQYWSYSFFRSFAGLFIIISKICSIHLYFAF